MEGPMLKRMSEPHTAGGVHVVTMVDELLRTHSRLLESFGATLGDPNVRNITRGLVLASIVVAPTPPTVARVARSLGYSRQAIQRIADDLAAQDYIAFEDNPDHKRARRMVPTDKGEAVYAESNKTLTAWADRLASAVGAPDIAHMNATLGRVRRYLEGLVREGAAPSKTTETT
jgi:DNA-binding MarR family transcriptional regulator